MDKRSIVARQINLCLFSARVLISSLTVLMLIAAGCAETVHQPSLKDLKSPDPAVRIQAIKWAGENKVNQAIPLLVEELEDEDYSVRLFAIKALEQITGNTQGYDWKSNPESRREAVAQWRKYLADKEPPSNPKEPPKQDTQK